MSTSAGTGNGGAPRSSSSRRFSVLLRPALLGALFVFFGTLLHLYHSSITVASFLSQVIASSNSEQKQGYNLSKERCKALKTHRGKWQHYFFSNNSDSINDKMTHRIRNSYTPLEMGWLTGNSSSWVGRSKAGGCGKYRDTHGLMFTSGLGNQCGCDTKEFLASGPSHSIWVSDHSNDDEQMSPSLRLIERLANENRSLCFMGDSIDHQFYDALTLNIERSILLRSNSSHIQIKAHEIPLNYTNKTGPSLYSSRGFRYASHLKQTVVSIQQEHEIIETKFTYMKHYGWAPGDTSHLDDCDIVITNLGLHYSAKTGNLTNPYSDPTPIPTLGDGILASIIHLADFASSDTDKIAIWRSALPQHFDTMDGHYMESARKDQKCTPLKPYSVGDDRVIQQYNTIYNEKFAELREYPGVQSNQSLTCDAYESKVRVNRTRMDLPTVYKYYIEKKCCLKRLERLKQGDASVTATVLRWDLTDLFDVPFWHSSDGDCSHFCYIPALYEAAFERLDLLIPPLTGS